MEPTNNNTEGNENCVNEGSFWHTNLDLYFGYQPGEVVEVEHEPNKYWLAIIRYSFKQLLSLDWVGDYGNFWIDLSNINASSSALTITEGYYKPRRLFPLGHHLQSQVKSQFSLEKPTKVLINPTLYDPKSDPYGNVDSVEDLLSLDADETNPKDKFGDQTSSIRDETNDLAITKACKAQISYGQEDADELEAALQNLNGEVTESHQTESQLADIKPTSPKNLNSNDTISQDAKDIIKQEQSVDNNQRDETNSIGLIKTENTGSIGGPTSTSIKSNDVPNNLCSVIKPNVDNAATGKEKQEDLDATQYKYDLDVLQLCKELQQNATVNGKYNGIGKDSDKTFHVKPKQFYDIGGANHERLLVPGTILDVCHTDSTSDEPDSRLELIHWFAIVLKNNGGLLTLRWLLCDDPKFKQGRLELKSGKSLFVREECPIDNDVSNKDNNSDLDKSDIEKSVSQDPRLCSKDITFTMHFCDIRIFSIKQNTSRKYRMPKTMQHTINQLKGMEFLESIHQEQCAYIFDPRRINLDKDRPLIDHLLDIIDTQRPNHININISTDSDLKQPADTEVLISTPKHIKLLRGFLKYQLEPGVFQIHSEVLDSNDEFFKFIYPYEPSFSVLPISWSEMNENCIANQSSRNPSPNFLSQTIIENNDNDKKDEHGVDSDQLGSGIDDIPPKPLPQLGPQINGLEKKTHEVDGASPSDSQTENPPTDCPTIVYDQSTVQINEPDIAHPICELDETHRKFVDSKYKLMGELEVLHDGGVAQVGINICHGRLRKVVYPLLWIQISADSYLSLPFNSTSIYPSGWAANNEISLISLLPPRKKMTLKVPPSSERRRKKLKINDVKPINPQMNVCTPQEELNLDTIIDKPLDISFLLKDDIMLDRIYFNHKCFTGPSLSKSKICSLPQYVGPGPLRLVMEEVVTKIISVAYVPPRILNDLSSRYFEDLLIERNLVNTLPIEFKAKYQKRIHREEIPVCLNPNDVALYCECICEHLKCCYNLFGPNLYDGDDCPGHCRALTKSNKFMKRATYYREKARMGEFITNDGIGSKRDKSQNILAGKNNSPTVSQPNSDNNQSRSHDENQHSSESNSSSSSTKSDNLESRPESSFDDPAVTVIKEACDVAAKEADIASNHNHMDVDSIKNDDNPGDDEFKPVQIKMEVDDNSKLFDSTTSIDSKRNQDVDLKINSQKIPSDMISNQEFHPLDLHELRPDEWSIEDVVYHLETSRLHKFRSLVISEHIDGQALLLLDRLALKEHFQNRPATGLSQDEISKFYRFVEHVKHHIDLINA